MPSFNDDFLQNFNNTTNIVKLLVRIGEYKGRQELYNVQIPEKLQTLKELGQLKALKELGKLKALKKVSIIQSIESSNRIEGVIAPIDRIKALVKNKDEPQQNRPENEIAGYRDVLEMIHDSASDIPFKDSVVLQFHRDLMAYAGGDGGRWKATQNIIQEKHSDGSVSERFVPTAPHLTESAMQNLHSGYETAVKERKHDKPVLIGLYILDFLCIHPFSDGNGRMSRLLTLLALYHQGYEVGRYISLEEIMERTKESYYDTLYKSSQGWHENKHDPLPWIEYWLGVLHASYARMEYNVQDLNLGYGAKSGVVIAAIEQQDGYFSIADLEKECPNVGREWIRKIVYSLKDEEKLENTGKGRGAKWRRIKKS